MVGTDAAGANGSAPPAGPRFGTWDIALLGLLGVFWGVAYVFIREGIVLGASPLPFAAVRYALSAAAFGAIAAVRRERWPVARELALSATVGGVLVIGLYGGFLYWGEQYTTGGYAAVLTSTAPILTVVVAFALLPGERLGRLGTLGIGIGFLGTVLLVVPELGAGPGRSGAGPLYVLAALVSASVGTVLLRRYGRGRQGLWQLGTQFGVAGLLLGVAAVLLPVPRAFPSVAGVWEALAILVVVSSILGYFTYYRLHHRVGPVRANTVAYLVPLVGLGVGSGFYGEPVSVWEIGGFLVVVVGMTLLLREALGR